LCLERWWPPVVNSSISMLLRSKSWLMGGSLATAATFVCILYVFFNPNWETNDDTGMSMIAHGYGIADIGSPNLIFSNVLWGYVVRAIPEINGVLGYSVATLGVLILVGTVLIYCLFRLGVGYLVCLSACALILVRPLLFPQFTINAGLLMAGTIICWNVYAQLNDRQTLVAGCCLAFLSYLVRYEEFFLVFFVALPLYPWRILLLRRSAKIAFVTLVSAIAIAAVIDYQAYQGEDWRAFNELEKVRWLFTDLGFGSKLKKSPDILASHGYSVNDVALFESLFLADPKIANPRALAAMLSKIDVFRMNAYVRIRLYYGWVGVKALWDRQLMPLLLAAVFLALLCPCWKIAATWALCIAAVFALGWFGRPGILRVYVPLVSLLVLAPFLAGVKITAWRKRLAASSLLVACYFNASYVFSLAVPHQFFADRTPPALADFPNEPIVDWAGLFPHQAVYSVLGQSSAAMHYRLYSLDCWTLVPGGVAFEEQKAGRGMIARFMSEQGVPIIAGQEQLLKLKIYCREHFAGDMKELSSRKYGETVVTVCRCEVKP
jgi:hypothetical protein